MRTLKEHCVLNSFPAPCLRFLSVSSGPEWRMLPSVAACIVSSLRPLSIDRITDLLRKEGIRWQTCCSGYAVTSRHMPHLYRQGSLSCVGTFLFRKSEPVGALDEPFWGCMIICIPSFYYYNFPSLEWIEEIPQPNLQFPLTEPVDSPSNLGLRCSIIHLNSCEKWPPYFLCNQLTIQLANSLYLWKGRREGGRR